MALVSAWRRRQARRSCVGLPGADRQALEGLYVSGALTLDQLSRACRAVHARRPGEIRDDLRAAVERSRRAGGGVLALHAEVDRIVSRPAADARVPLPVR